MGWGSFNPLKSGGFIDQTISALPGGTGTGLPVVHNPFTGSLDPTAPGNILGPSGRIDTGIGNLPGGMGTSPQTTIEGLPGSAEGMKASIGLGGGTTPPPSASGGTTPPPVIDNTPVIPDLSAMTIMALGKKRGRRSTNLTGGQQTMPLGGMVGYRTIVGS